MLVVEKECANKTSNDLHKPNIKQKKKSPQSYITQSP